MVVVAPQLLPLQQMARPFIECRSERQRKKKREKTSSRRETEASVCIICALFDPYKIFIAKYIIIMDMR